MSMLLPPEGAKSVSANAIQHITVRYGTLIKHNRNSGLNVKTWQERGKLKQEISAAAKAASTHKNLKWD